MLLTHGEDVVIELGGPVFLQQAEGKMIQVFDPRRGIVGLGVEIPVDDQDQRVFRQHHVGKFIAVHGAVAQKEHIHRALVELELQILYISLKKGKGAKGVELAELLHLFRDDRQGRVAGPYFDVAAQLSRQFPDIRLDFIDFQKKPIGILVEQLTGFRQLPFPLLERKNQFGAQIPVPVF